MSGGDENYFHIFKNLEKLTTSDYYRINYLEVKSNKSKNTNMDI